MGAMYVVKPDVETMVYSIAQKDVATIFVLSVMTRIRRRNQRRKNR
jgi:hypothetical protein